MPDIIEEQIKKATTDNDARTAHSLYQDILTSEMTRLQRDFYDAQQKQDVNTDGGLDRDELKFGAFANKEATQLNKFLLKNYDDLANLPLGKKTSPGVTAESLQALERITGNSSDQVHYLHRPLTDRQMESVINGGLLYGLAGGAALSGTLYAASRFLPGKLKMVALGGACVAPIAAPVVGGYFALKNTMDEHEKIPQNKIDVAQKIISNSPEIFSAPAAYDRILSARTDRLEDQYRLNSRHVDVDSDGNIDKQELQLAIANSVGDNKLNKLLLNNYKDLETLSQSLGEPYQTGISDAAIRSLKPHTFTDASRFSPQESMTRGRLAHEAGIKGALYGGAVGGVLTGGLAMCFRSVPVPGKIGLAVGGALLGMIGEYHLSSNQSLSESDRFLQDRKDALRRVRQSL